MSRRAYPEYKPSIIEWLGRIPKYWVFQRAKYIMKEVSDGSLTGEEALLSVSEYTGVRPRVEILAQGEYITRADSLEGYKRCKAGDLVMNIMLAWKRGQGVAPCSGIVSPAYAVYRLLPEDADNRFIHYLVRSDEYVGLFAAWSYGVIPSRWRLYPEVFLRLPFLLPPLGEQRAIAAFLDRETARIDSLIEKKQRQIELLQEKRAALISHAVTKGLNANAKMKDSGIEWLGKIPKQWEQKSLKYMTRILRGKFTHRPRNDPRMYGGSYPFIQTGDVAAASKYIRDYHQTLSEDGLTVSKMFPKGTLVMTIAANIGDMAILDFEACFPDSIVGFVPKRDVTLDYLYYLLIGMRPALLSTATLNTQLNLNIDRIGSLVAVQPPLSEQRAIVEQLEAQVGNINKLTEQINISIALLREYRTALISSTVTGKVDVRNEVSA